MKQAIVCQTGIPGEEKRNVFEEILKKIITKKFPKVMTTI